MKVVIMAGGKGTRISSVASDIPKPMIKIEGKPVLEHELECLRDQGFTDIIITVSHLGNIIMDYFGDGSGTSPVTGKPFGVHIEYYFEKEPLGNAGALFKIKDNLTSDFLLLNADAMFDYDQAELTDSGKMTLSMVLPTYCKVLLDDSYKKYLGEIIIDGYTDTDGDYSYNLELSQKRSLAVAQYLLDIKSACLPITAT